MPKIQNVSLVDVFQGNHFACGSESMLIQIIDPPIEGYTANFPIPKHTFKEVHQFRFLDVEKDNPVHEQYGITDNQAEQIVGLLQRGLAENLNIVVHCHVGVCRSGAVAEIGVMMGFEDMGNYRIPNLLVKGKLMSVLGWGYADVDDDTNPNPII